MIPAGARRGKPWHQFAFWRGGKFAWRGLLACAARLAAEWPFVSRPDYTGPLVKALGGADISCLIGWLAAAACLPGTRGAARACRAGRQVAAAASGTGLS
jgi:hypothetical protein